MREHLLELIDEQADERIACAAHRVDEGRAAVAPAVEDAAQLQPARVGVGALRAGRVDQGLGQMGERCVARRHHPRDPLPPAARRVLLQARQHAGADQRALAAAGVAVDDEEPLADQPADDVVDHLLAAEEDRPFVLAERPQPRIGAGRKRDGEDVGRGRVGAHRPPAAALFCVSHVLTSIGQGERVPSIQSTCSARAVRRRASVAIGAPAVSTRPHGT